MAHARSPRSLSQKIAHDRRQAHDQLALHTLSQSRSDAILPGASLLLIATARCFPIPTSANLSRRARQNPQSDEQASIARAAFHRVRLALRAAHTATPLPILRVPRR